MRRSESDLGTRQQFPAGIRRIIEKEILPQMPQPYRLWLGNKGSQERRREHYEEFASSEHLRNTLNKAPTAGQLRTVAKDMLPLIPYNHRYDFFRLALPAALAKKPKAGSLTAIAKAILPEVAPEDRFDFVRHRVPELLEGKPSKGEIMRQAQLAKKYLEKSAGRYSARKIIADNAGKLAPLQHGFHRFSFTKSDSAARTGSMTIPLGGRLFGTIVRIVPLHAFEAWKLAYEKGVPVEPILRRKDGRLRARPFTGKDGRKYVRVLTRYCGERLTDFTEKHPEHEKEANAQKRRILMRLETLGVKHRDEKLENFTVEIARGKPLVRLIDWDFAQKT